MITEDYLTRLFVTFIQALMKARLRAIDEEDMQGAADLLENAIGNAANMDASMFLNLAPESISQILQATDTDKEITEFMARSLMQAAEYRKQAGQTDLADLRKKQAEAIAKAYGHDLTIKMEDFLSKYDYAQEQS